MDREAEVLRALTILLKASGSVTNMLKKDMQSYGLNPTEFTVMEVLFNKGEQPIQIIGNKVLLASSSITYVIDQLEKKNLVERKVNENDRRVTLVSLTSEGNQLMEEIFPQHTDIICDLFSDVSDEDLLQFSENMKSIGYKAVDLYENDTK
jgi:MarR family 2-MHQ and catechol resistance regulon transcriptional repressor